MCNYAAALLLSYLRIIVVYNLTVRGPTKMDEKYQKYMDVNSRSSTAHLINQRCHAGVVLQCRRDSCAPSYTINSAVAANINRRDRETTRPHETIIKMRDMRFFVAVRFSIQLKLPRIFRFASSATTMSTPPHELLYHTSTVSASSVSGSTCTRSTPAACG